MKKIYQNFDGLDVTFQCAVPNRILLELDAAQQEAKESRQPVILSFNGSDTQVEVAENGMKGGYAYRFDTGSDGAIWAVAASDDPERWNVRVSAKSLMLALHGYEGTKERILAFLEEELLAIPPQDCDRPTERISRVDFCIDFIAEDGFLPDPKRFLTHNRSKKSYHGKIPPPDIFDLEIICMDRGKEIESVTIGKMPNRQLIVYNKRREITTKQKLYWWDIWGIKPEETEAHIWRVEARAGKKELNKYQLRRFADFENRIGDVMVSILKSYRYIVPNECDRNRSRWPLETFWQDAIKATELCLAPYICKAKRKDVILAMEKVIHRRYKDSLQGTITSYSAALGYDASEIPAVLDRIQSEVLDSVAKNPHKFLQKHKKAEKKFEFILPEKNS